MEKIFITGGAGFIGSHLVDRLMLNPGNNIVVYDNLSSGKKEFIKKYFKQCETLRFACPKERSSFGNKKFTFIKGDLLNFNKLKKAMDGCDFVYHLAANPDIQQGLKHTNLDLEQNTIATYNVLEAMRLNNIKKIVFSSTSAVYGEPKIFPTPEYYSPLEPISLYGASKLACEGFIEAYCNLFGFQAWIIRFANIVGPRSTHGVIFDFMRKLKKNPKEIEILGDGNQKKSYLHVFDLIEGMQFAIEHSNDKINFFNLGSGDQITVKEIASILIKQIGLKNVKYRFTGGKRGWPGDVFFMQLAVDKINKLGWSAKYNSRKAVEKTVRNLAN